MKEGREGEKAHEGIVKRHFFLEARVPKQGWDNRCKKDVRSFQCAMLAAMRVQESR